MKPILYREYKIIDKPQIIRCIEELRDFLIRIDNEKLTTRMPLYGEKAFEAIYKNVETKEGKLFVAEDEQKIVGFIACYVLPKDVEGQYSLLVSKIGFISDIYINESTRGKNIGSSLMKLAENHLKSIGCDLISIDVFAPNSKAFEFYNKHGYINRLVNLVKKV